MKVEMVAIGTIQPYHRNPRDNRKAVAGVAESIKRYGWQQPIVIDTKRIIIVGDTRYRAALSLGLRTVPIVVTKLSKKKAHAYRIADNKVAEASEWDDELLKLELADLMVGDELVEFVGIMGDELHALMDDDQVQEDLLNGSTADGVDASMYGGATALTRGSAPWRYWKKTRRLKGSIIDFGSGKEHHDHARYDIVHAPDIAPLLECYDTVVCNYVLNVQPTDHLVDLILALLAHLTKSNGTCLIAVQTGKASKTNGASPRIRRTPSEWAETIGRFFKVTKVDASFCGFVCKPK